ncbi:prephenate dehydrogenase/arogenate dehydrogenase family protein [Candidatus Poribacteria bacterium]|nr:prephenate dehydrogenase/arogenate dehydrogenase family protein [Candidatus Poribacteria bacterium]
MTDDTTGQSAPLADVRTLALYGVGLINGSLGLALRARGFAGRIVGVGRRERTLRAAADRGAIDSYGTGPSAAADADLVVVGTPVDITVDVIAELTQNTRPSTIYSDVGSVKAGIVTECAARLPDARFVGAHPIAGSERAGVEHASADLFDGAKCVVTTGPGADEEAGGVVRRLWETVGSQVITLPADVHDVLLAASSHLPHVVATALTHVVCGKAADGAQAAEFGGGGLRDTTRVALGSSEIWTPIVVANAEPVAALAERMADELLQLAGRLRRGDAGAVDAWLERGRELRAEITDGI